jgi:hypothetical protein
MGMRQISERGGYERSAAIGRLRLDDRPCMSRIARFRQLILLAIGTYFSCSPALWSQTSDSPAGEAASSWTATTESQSGNINPTRSIESHTQSGNRTLDRQSLQRRGADGQFEPYQEIEKETVQLDATSVRTITRTFGRDANGAKTLVQVTEEERHALPGGDSNVVSTISNPDGNGKLQLIQRQIEETKKASADVKETKTTILLPNGNGGLAPAMKVQERRQRSANDTVESQQTTLLPDGAGNWQVSEIRRASATKEGSTSERISRRDAEGKLSEVSRTVSNEAESAPGEKRDTVETYSVDVPGSVGDGKLHLVERTITAQRAGSAGQQITEHQVQRPSPGDPGSSLQVTIQTTDTVRPDSSGAQATRTVQARDVNGNFGIVLVDTTKSDNIHAIQIQIAPSEKPK